MTSFIKFDGYFQADDDDFGYAFGYLPFAYLADMIDDGMKPFSVLGLRPGPGTTFSVVPGKLDAGGSLIPCEVESVGSGTCFTSRSWEIGLGSKSFLNTIYSTETDAWIAPYGSSMTNQCFEESQWYEATRVRPVALTGEARSNNNVAPPSEHARPPLPHESTEFSLTLKDGGGFGWWNTIKYHSNQYVLDDGEKILHRGTLVDKAEVTEKFRLKDGTYHLRMLGNLDADAGDDTWSLTMKDREIASGGRYDRVSFTVSKGGIASVVTENVIDILGINSAPFTLGTFPGLVTSEQLHSMTNDPELLKAQSVFFNHLLGDNAALSGDSSSSSFADSLFDHPLESIGLLAGSALIGMVSMLGVLRFFSPAKGSYAPVLDESRRQAAAVAVTELQLERPLKKEVRDCEL